MAEQSAERVRDDLRRGLEERVRKSRDLANALCLIHSDRSRIHWTYTAGTIGPDRNPIAPENPFHIASIGKTFTSVLTALLCEKKRLHWSDPISKYLPADLLKGLFVHEGKDYSSQVLVRQLLNHTSGIADYFEDKPKKGKSIKELIVEDPGRFWKPEDTFDFAREYLTAVSPPGKKFHYSDTGYNLLGKIIENVSGRSLSENLHADVFHPLGMKDSCFHFYSKPETENPLPLADTYLGDINVATFKSISVDWAGGGIVSTLEDLLLFHKALVHHTLVKPETFHSMSEDRGRFGFGMDYGYGLFFLNVARMTLVLPRALNMWGNMGSIAAYMFYNPFYDVYLIGTFNHSRYVRKQVVFLIGVMRKMRGLLR